MRVFQVGATGASEGLTVSSERGVGTYVKVGAKGRLLVSGVPSGQVLKHASISQIRAPGRDGVSTFLAPPKDTDNQIKALLLTNFHSNGAHLEGCEVVASFANAFKLVKAAPGATIWWYSGRIGHSPRLAIHWRGGEHLPRYGAYEDVVPITNHHAKAFTVHDNGAVASDITILGDRLRISGVTVPIDPDVVRKGGLSEVTAVWYEQVGKLPATNRFVDPYGIGGPHNAAHGKWEIQLLWPGQPSPKDALVVVTRPKWSTDYFKVDLGHAWKLVEGHYRTDLVVLAPETVIRYGRRESVGQGHDFVVKWSQGVLTAGRADKILEKAE